MSEGKWVSQNPPETRETGGEAAAASKGRGGGGRTGGRGRQVRVLLAEDDAMIRELMELILQGRDWQVVSAGDGGETIAKWEAGTFDLILMDLQMPGVNGLEATRTIREREKGTGRHVPIIALTAYVGKEDLEACIKAGMDACITKPIRLERLFALAERYLPPGRTAH